MGVYEKHRGLIDWAATVLGTEDCSDWCQRDTHSTEWGAKAGGTLGVGRAQWQVYATYPGAPRTAGPTNRCPSPGTRKANFEKRVARLWAGYTLRAEPTSAARRWPYHDVTGQIDRASALARAQSSRSCRPSNSPAYHRGPPAGLKSFPRREVPAKQRTAHPGHLR